MRITLTTLSAVLVLSAAAWAQPAPPPGLPPGPPPGIPAAEGEYLELDPDANDEFEEDDNDSMRLEGDTVKLANGRELAGVRVLRETARGVEVEVLKGTAPLLIPRRQVVEIIYDRSRDRRDGARRDDAADQGRRGMVSASELSPELHDKLTTPLNEEPLSIDDQDFLVILDRLLGQADIPLDVDPLVRDLPPVRRNWSRQVPPGTNALTLLKEHFEADFPAVEVVNEFDRVVIRMRRDADEDF